MEKINIRNLLEDIEVELTAWGSWGGHTHCFKYMSGGYRLLAVWMKENGMNTKKLDDAYEKAVCEFKKISADKKRSFMKDSDTELLERLDNRFFDELKHVVQMVEISL